MNDERSTAGRSSFIIHHSSFAILVDGEQQLQIERFAATRCGARLLIVYRGYATYQQRADGRQIPVMVLEPAE